MARPSDLPGVQHFQQMPCGTRAKYVAARCRCLLCRAAASRYETERLAKRKAGEWNGLVDAAPVRQHLLRLSRQGVGYKSVAASADVGKTTVFKVLAGAKTRLRAMAARRILAVDRDAVADHALISAGPTWRLLNHLLEEGFTKSELARRLGSKSRTPSLQLRTDVGRELPPVIRIPHRIDADTAAIDRIENSAAELAKIILSQNEAFRGQKLQASEELSVMLRQATGIAKAPYVADFVRLLVESGEKVVLCGWHRAVYDVWASKLKDLAPVFYTGEETAVQKEASKQRFVNGDARVFIMSLRAGAGMNDLQMASSVIVFGELDWSPGVHEQCIGRLARDGQEASVAAYFLVADRGSDPIVSETLGLKREQVEGIRNPNQDTLEQLQTDDGRTKKLAAAYLKQIGQVAPVEDELEATA